ncbi:uncharacterized protein LOC128239825 [Mya arenaria]|nr:uncharacterized protein LOC128239824 isoform X2 [Mya arenaria]XP_052812224.1 uncharacterized protein LOC128239824 isoform X2 [Mya arenaria]XP_052812225.1 uncharacterized protein LOC128239824 isoform X2 [Mya arenaria]XP_052812226.1 uncharacterized protein LOC128239825 [Mya arenaria]XP_052812227.1 uncharacterized protein LOC128239825 [Mya arenaria]
MSLQSSRPQVQMGSPSSTDSHYSKPMQKDVVGLPSLPDLVTSFWGVLANPFKYYSQVKAVVPDNYDVNNQTSEDISLKKCKNVKMNESIENTKVKLKNYARRDKEKEMPPAVCTEQTECISDKKLKYLICLWFFINHMKSAGATSGHCNLEIRDEVVNATWSTTNGHSTLFRGNGRLIAYCDPMFNNAYLSNASDDGVYHAHFENGSICRVNFSLPSQTEMSIQIESVTGGLDTVHINGQVVHCNNATMALANIKGATSGHCNLELRDEVVNATWSTTNGHSTLFRGNGRLIAYCDPMYNNAYLSNASDDGVYHAHFENGSICRVNFSLPSQTEMSIQIESVTGGLDTVHVNGQLVHCNNATMALANITVEVKTDGSKEAETDGRKKAEFAGSIEAKTDNSDWLILLVAVPILIALGWISKLRFCGKQELDRQNLPDAA